jgi:hypothetical protein
LAKVFFWGFEHNKIFNATAKPLPDRVKNKRRRVDALIERKLTCHISPISNARVVAKSQTQKNCTTSANAAVRFSADMI